MCYKNSCEAGTQEVDMINTKTARLLETGFFMFYLINYFKTMLILFSNQHSKTECNWKSWVVFSGLSTKTSPAKVLHYAGVAVVLELLLLKNNKLVLMHLPRLFYNFTAYINFAKCNRNLLVL